MSSQALTSLRFERLLLTGAAGGLGRVLRPRLKRYCNALRLSDIAELGAAEEGEELRPVRLEDRAAVLELLEGVSAVVHLGGVSTEASFEPVAPWRKRGSSGRPCRRSFEFGGCAVEETGPRNGAFGAEKFGFESLEAVHWNLTAPRLYEYAIAGAEAKLAYGGALAAETGVHTGRSPKDKFIVKDGMTERTVWWDNTSAAHLGFRPQDSSEPFRAAAEARQPSIDLADPASIFQGGAFVRTGPFDN